MSNINSRSINGGYYIMNCLCDDSEDIQQTHDIGKKRDSLYYEGVIIQKKYPHLAFRS